MPWRQPALAPLFNLSERRSSNAQDSGTEGFSLPVPAFEPASAGELPALATSTSSTRPTLVARAEARPSPPPVRLNTARVATRGSGAGGSSSFHSGRGRAHPGGAQETQKKLGMLNGVLIPTCENMWGVLIFLRFYAIVGSAGLGLTFLIVALSFLVALCTSLSLSAIATCGTSHKLQGVYPLLARALGKEMAVRAAALRCWLRVHCPPLPSSPLPSAALPRRLALPARLALRPLTAAPRPPPFSRPPAFSPPRPHLAASACGAGRSLRSAAFTLWASF